MKCPNCGREIEKIQYLGAPVDMCPDCRGIWSEENDFEQFLRYVWKECDGLLISEPGAGQEEDKKFNSEKMCPRCRLNLIETKYSPYSSVILNKCPACKGIWSDAGSVEKLAKERWEDFKLTATTTLHPVLKKKYDNQAETTVSVGSFFKYFFSLAWGLPVASDLKAASVPFVSYAIILINIGVFLLQKCFIENANSFFMKYGFVVTKMFSFSGLLAFFTSLFLHAGWMHLLSNMFFLWLFCAAVEEFFGHYYFLVFYFLCGIAANLLHSVANISSPAPLVGASGAIAGVLGAYFLLYPGAMLKIWFPGASVIKVPAFVYLGIWIYIQIVSGFNNLHSVGIGWFAHVGGFMAGAAAAHIVRDKRLERDARAPHVAAAAPAPGDNIQ